MVLPVNHWSGKLSKIATLVGSIRTFCTTCCRLQSEQNNLLTIVIEAVVALSSKNIIITFMVAPRDKVLLELLDNLHYFNAVAPKVPFRWAAQAGESEPRKRHVPPPLPPLLIAAVSPLSLSQLRPPMSP